MPIKAQPPGGFEVACGRGGEPEQVQQAFISQTRDGEEEAAAAEGRCFCWNHCKERKVKEEGFVDCVSLSVSSGHKNRLGEKQQSGINLNIEI